MTTNAEGRFNFENIPPGAELDVLIRAEGYGSVRVTNITTVAGKAELGVIPLPPANRPLKGVVLDIQGHPLCGAMVAIRGERQPANSGITDLHGRFSFNAVCEGPVQLEARDMSNNSTEFSAQGGDTNLVLQLRPTIKAQ
jgi:hypothetical protein